MTFFSTDEGNYFGNNIGFPVEDALQFQSQLLLAQANDGLVTLSDGTTEANFEVWYFDFSPNEFSPNSALLYLEPVGVEGFVEGTLIQDAFGYIPSGGIEITFEYTPYDCITQENIHEAVALWMTNYWDADSIYGPISEWDVSQVTDMSRLFSQDLHLLADGYDEPIPQIADFNEDITGWDVSNVTNMYRMFYGASAFNQNISTWDMSSAQSIHMMFDSAIAFDQPIGSWDVSNVMDMHRVFRSTTFNQDLSAWNTSNVTDMFGMFTFSQFSQDISNWNVSSVTNMGDMFRVSAFNQDISSWNVSSATRMEFMFYNASLANFNLGGWDISNVTDMQAMFNGSNLTTSEYDQILVAWSGQSVQPDVLLGASQTSWCSDAAGSARDALIASGWTINDGDRDPSCIPGCTDQAACNFDVAAGVDDGSCTYLDECGVCGGSGLNLTGYVGAFTDNIAETGFTGNFLGIETPLTEQFVDLFHPFNSYSITIESGGITATFPISYLGGPVGYDYRLVYVEVDGDEYGFLSTYFPDGVQIGDSWTIQDAFCDCDQTIPPLAYDCDGNCLSDADGDGVCDPFDQCSDLSACNYADPANGSCQVLDECGVCGGDNSTCLGCTDGSACNYSEDATVDDGSCTYPGCMNSDACNYSADAACDDGSCEFTENLIYSDFEHTAGGNGNGNGNAGGNGNGNSGGSNGYTNGYGSSEVFWSIWNDGGSDCRLAGADAGFATSGTRCVRLRDNSSTSHMVTDNLAFDDFGRVDVTFNFVAASMESGESFHLEYSLDGGANFVRAATYVSGVDFANGVTEWGWSEGIVADFTDETQFRFRCDASNNQDYIYLDDIYIHGCGGAEDLRFEEELGAPVALDLAKLAGRIYPNPATGLLQIEWKMEGWDGQAELMILDYTGRIALQSQLPMTQQVPHSYDITGLTRGLYVVQILAGDARWTEQLIIQ